MSVFSGDFLGFTLGDVHSSQFNITRVSSSDRYTDNLVPNIKDTIVEIPGGDGQYYISSTYNQRIFSLDFAYDDLRDEDLRALRQVFGFKGMRPLIFDEFPYKKYMVKVQQAPVFKYICFDSGDMRLYKGEGNVSLIAYYPFALATFSPSVKNKTMGAINNVGDLNAQVKIYFTAQTAAGLSEMSLKDLNETEIGRMELDAITIQDADAYILFDSSTHLVEGLDESFNKTGNLYNKFIHAGDFFDAPLGRSVLTSNVAFYNLTYTPIYY